MDAAPGDPTVEERVEHALASVRHRLSSEALDDLRMLLRVTLATHPA
jgi:hypothetical protein